MNDTVLVKKLRKGLQELAKERKEREFEYGKHKLGRILTVVDSAIADPEQRKASKDLVQTIWYEDGAVVGGDRNLSNEALLFAALTDELALWEPEENPLQYAQPYNPFTDKVK